MLSENRIENRYSENSKNPSLLAGKLFDDKDNYMSPSHSNTRNRKYRYYISQAILQFKKNEAGSVAKIPAGEIETFVINEISRFVFNRSNIHKYIENFDVNTQKDILDSLKNQNINLKGKLSPHFIRAIISKIILHKEKTEIIFCKNQLKKALKSLTYGTDLPEEIKKESENQIILSIPIQIVQTPRKGSLVIISESSHKEPNINPQLIKAIARSHYWNNLLYSGKAKSIPDIQKLENFNDGSYIAEILKLKFLAPDITESILNGTQPIDLNIKKLRRIKTLDWEEQRKFINA